MISTQNLSPLPDIERLKLLTQSLAMLDAIIEPDWEGRYYSFNAHWKAGEAMASMRDGSGDGYYILFESAGAVIKGFAHESVMSPYQTDPLRLWAGVLDDVPTSFVSFLAEPAFSLSDTTFCIWRTPTDSAWQHGKITFPNEDGADGSADLLAILDGNPASYRNWAEEYYERPIDLAAVTHIYEHRALTEAIIQQLNPDISLADLTEDITEIGY